MTSQHMRLFHPLGAYISPPHGPDEWFANFDRSELYKQDGERQYEVFTREATGRATRYGAKLTTRREWVAGLKSHERASVRRPHFCLPAFRLRHLPLEVAPWPLPPVGARSSWQVAG